MSGEFPRFPHLQRLALAWLVGMIVLAAVGAPCAMGQDSRPTFNYSDPNAIAEGARLFAEHCAVCHGAGAVGENPRRPIGGKKPEGGFFAPALNGSGHAWHHSPQALHDHIKVGSPLPDSPMRAMGGKLSDLQIHAVIAYLRSLWPEQIRESYRRRFPQ